MNIFKSRFFVIYLMTFINGLSFSLLIPIFPFLIKIYSQPEIVLGLFAASFSFFQFIWSPIMWALSDKFWRKPVLILTQAWTFLSWIILWLAYFLPEYSVFWYLTLPVIAIFISRMFDGITWWNMSVLSAMIWDLTSKEERTEIFWKNSAMIWVSMLVWPSMWAFAMTTSFWYLWTAILWWLVSLVAFFVLIVKLEESLKDENKNTELKMNFKSLNIFSQIKKYWNIWNVKSAVILKTFFYSAFMIYTTVSILYIIDNFGFSVQEVWFYMIATWTFFIFHQLISVKFFSQKYWDFNTMVIWFISLFIWYLGMWFSPDIYIYTFFYFFSILWVALLFTTLQSLFSKSATEKQQWEIMWIATWIESFISIIIPILWAYIYQVSDISIFIIISFFPVLALAFYFLFLRKCIK